VFSLSLRSDYGGLCARLNRVVSYSCLCSELRYGTSRERGRGRAHRKAEVLEERAEAKFVGLKHSTPVLGILELLPSRQLKSSLGVVAVTPADAITKAGVVLEPCLPKPDQDFVLVEAGLLSELSDCADAAGQSTPNVPRICRDV
jgi:hypothetical protein